MIRFLALTAAAVFCASGSLSAQSIIKKPVGALDAVKLRSVPAAAHVNTPKASGAPMPMAPFPALFDTVVIPQLENTANCDQQIAAFPIRYQDGNIFNGTPSGAFPLNANVNLHQSENGVRFALSSQPGYQARLRAVAFNKALGVINGTPDSFAVFLNRVSGNFQGNSDIATLAEAGINATTKWQYKFTLNDVLTIGNPATDLFTGLINLDTLRSQVFLPTAGNYYLSLGETAYNATSPDSLAIGFLITNSADSLANGEPCGGINWWLRYRNTATGGYFNAGATQIAFANTGQALGANGEFQPQALVILPIFEYFTMRVQASASSTTVPCGGSTNLSAVSNYLNFGGTNNVTYSWAPTTGLNNPNSRTPTASNITVPTTYTVTATFGAQSVTSTVFVNVQAPFSVTASAASSSVECGESTQLSASLSAPQPGATYSWSPTTFLSDPTSPNPTFNAGASTVYTVTVVSAGCGAAATVAVNVNAAFSITTPTNVSADCGAQTTITAQPSPDAPAGLVYSWTVNGDQVPGVTGPSLTQVFEANSTVAVSAVDPAAGCGASSTSQVTVAPLTVTASGGGSIGCGASANLSASSAAVATFSWAPATGLNDANIANPVASPGATTVYTVTATSGSCTATATVVVNVGTSINVTAQVPPAGSVTCGAVADLSVANPIAGVTYTWTPNLGFVGSNVGTNVQVQRSSGTVTYTVTATLAGASCSGTAVATFSVAPANFGARFNSLVTNGKCADSLNTVATTNQTPNRANYNFVWNAPGALNPTETGEQPTFSYDRNGTFQILMRVILKSFTECEETFSRDVTVRCTTETSRADDQLARAYTVYPNPAQGQLNLKLTEAGAYSYVLSNTVGQAVANGAVATGGTHEETIDIRGLAPGVYTLTLTEGVAVSTTKVVIQ